MLSLMLLFLYLRPLYLPLRVLFTAESFSLSSNIIVDTATFHLRCVSPLNYYYYFLINPKKIVEGNIDCRSFDCQSTLYKQKMPLSEIVS